MDITALRTEYAQLTEQAQKYLDTASTEKREFSEEENTGFSTAENRMKVIKAQLDRQNTLAGLAFSENKNVELPSEPKGREEMSITVGETFDRRDQKISLHQFNRSVNDWFRMGRPDATLAKFTTINGGTDSGILMPTSVVAPLNPSALNPWREGLQVYGMEPWKTPTAENIVLPIFTASAGGTVSGTATSETENEPGVTESIVSETVTYASGDIWFENRLLASQSFDLLSASIPGLVYSKELAFEAAIASAMTGDSAITNVTYTATTTGLTYSNMVTLNRSLPKRYQSLKVMVVSKACYTALENLTTTTGFPILNMDAQNQNLKKFNGVPVVFSESLGSFGANNVVGVIFSWIGARLRDAGEGDILQRFTQAYQRPGQTGANLLSYNSFGYSPLACGKLVCPAS